MAFLHAQRSGQGTADGHPRAITTVRRYLSTLATLHRLLELPDPAASPLVRQTLKGLGRGVGDALQAAPLRWVRTCRRSSRC
ncbi:hypothetical protein [Thiocystis violacea]|uniref:hypothetical protein n=1 Tax=Thiocystis violacea TaxID=13725 RepID=UPI001903600E|nr:hypothetical protein [Thiocystis violacea]MBK1720534.1 hypothetical protein [Thiocystis violacea]